MYSRTHRSVLATVGVVSVRGMNAMGPPAAMHALIRVSVAVRILMTVMVTMSADKMRRAGPAKQTPIVAGSSSVMRGVANNA